jgi:hypothetical protein
LTKGRTGRIWLVFLLTGIINFALGAAIALPVTLTVAVMTRGRLTLGLAIAAQVAQFLASTLAGPNSRQQRRRANREGRNSDAESRARCTVELEFKLPVLPCKTPHWRSCFYGFGPASDEHV